MAEAWAAAGVPLEGPPTAPAPPHGLACQNMKIRLKQVRGCALLWWGALLWWTAPIWRGTFCGATREVKRLKASRLSQTHCPVPHMTLSLGLEWRAIFFFALLV